MLSKKVMLKMILRKKVKLFLLLKDSICELIFIMLSDSNVKAFIQDYQDYQDCSVQNSSWKPIRIQPVWVECRLL